MADNNQQPESNEPPENEPWEKENWAKEQSYAQRVMAGQRAEAERARVAAAQKAEQERQAAEEQENREWEEAEWSARLAAAKGADRGGEPNAENAENEPQLKDDQKLKKEADGISEKIKEEKKKTGADYMLVYFFLTILGGAFDIIGVICDLLPFLFWINLILGPIYTLIRFLGLRYANAGIKDDRQMTTSVITTLVSGAISTVGVPSRAASMVMEFGARRVIAEEAAKNISDLQKKRDKLLGPVLAKQYRPPR